MKRIPITALAGLGLILAACDPVAVTDTAPPPDTPSIGSQPVEPTGVPGEKETGGTGMDQDPSDGS